MASAKANASADDLRSPIICIMGHVDTGKTKLLDNVRRSNVQDKEVNGITQQIGASFVPEEPIATRAASLLERHNMKIQVPGLLIIDTPGHESFSNLRSRGSSMCDIAILVVDIMHGLEQQTIESLNMLRSKKTPFVVALNKMDRLYAWKENKDFPIRDTLAKQEDSVIAEFDNRVAATILAFNEQGLNAALYYKNKDFRDTISLVPTSAHTGEGVPDLLMLMVQYSQKMMTERVMYVDEVQCTVLEVKTVEGLGYTIDVILGNGTLREGDTVVLCGFNGPIVTKIRALLTPKPMKEMRVKGEYDHHKEIKAAQGIKISADDLEHVVAGSSLLLLTPEDNLDVLKEEVMADLTKLSKQVSELSHGKGVYAMASTLGSLEALLDFLKSCDIPVAAINLGPIHKKDVMKASVMLEHKDTADYGVILAFDVPYSKDTELVAKELGVTVFTGDVIYHLFDKFTAYMTEVRKRKQEAANLVAVFPSICHILPACIFVRGGGGDPIVVGMEVMEGQLKKGTPVCVQPRNAPGTFLDIGRVISIEDNHKAVDIAGKGKSVAVKIDPVQSIMYGRQFDHTDAIYSRLSRASIDALKDFFKDDLSKEDWRLVVKLKQHQGVQ